MLGELLALSLAAAAPASAVAGEFESGIRRVSFKAEGILCKLCAGSIRRGFSALDGYQDCRISATDGRVEVVFHPRSTTTTLDALDRIKSLGFSVSDIRITIAGRLRRWSRREFQIPETEGVEYWGIEPPHGEALLLLMDEDHNPVRYTDAMRGKKVTVTGRVHNHAYLPPVLTILQIEEPPAEPEAGKDAPRRRRSDQGED